MRLKKAQILQIKTGSAFFTFRVRQHNDGVIKKSQERSIKSIMNIPTLRKAGKIKYIAAILAFVTFSAVFGGNAEQSAAATNFRDIPANYWAATSIQFASQQGIVNGYKGYDGSYTYKPEQYVTCEEAAVMLYRALKVSGNINDETDYTGEYLTLLNQHEIADYSRRAVAYFLKKDIFNPAELAGFNKGIAKGNPAPRAQVAAWIAKSMEKGFVGVFFVPYEDMAQIHAGEMQYIDLLYRYGIMKGSLTESGSVRFEPRQGVKRSEFAAIANRVYDFKKSSIEATKFSLKHDYVTYKNSIGNMVFDKDAHIIYNGKFAAGLGSIDKNKIFAISSLAIDRNKKQQVHIQSQPVLVSGRILQAENIDDGMQLITLQDAEGHEIVYIKTEETKMKDGWVMLYAGKDATFIADGAKIVEFTSN